MVTTILGTVSNSYRRDLRIFLASVPELDVIATVETAAELATAVAIPIPTVNARLLILDYALLVTAVPLLRAISPPIPCLILAETIPQLQHALTLGADCALLRGFSAAEFFIGLRSLNLRVSAANLPAGRINPLGTPT